MTFAFCSQPSVYKSLKGILVRKFLKGQIFSPPPYRLGSINCKNMPTSVTRVENEEGIWVWHMLFIREIESFYQPMGLFRRLNRDICSLTERTKYVLRFDCMFVMVYRASSVCRPNPRMKKLSIEITRLTPRDEFTSAASSALSLTSFLLRIVWIS